MSDPRPAKGGGAPYCLDLHTHSADGSDDAGASVEGYLRSILRLKQMGYRIDGFVLTEHRGFDLQRDYSDLARRYGVAVLRGVEIETDAGHVLVYGVSAGFLREFDLSDVSLPHHDVFEAAQLHGGIAVAAHPGRRRIGMFDPVREPPLTLETVQVAEVLNGASSDQENAFAAEVAQDRGLRTVGGSDAHFVSEIARCGTAFTLPVRSDEELVEQLRTGQIWPIRIRGTSGSKVQGLSSRMVSSSNALQTPVADARARVGIEHQVGSIQITEDLVANYHGLHQSASGVRAAPPAVFSNPLAKAVPPDVLFALTWDQEIEPQLRFGDVAFLAGRRIESVCDIHVGDTITGFGSLEDVFEKTGRSGHMIFVKRQIRYVDQRGETVARLETTMAHLGIGRSWP